MWGLINFSAKRLVYWVRVSLVVKWPVGIFGKGDVAWEVICWGFWGCKLPKLISAFDHTNNVGKLACGWLYFFVSLAFGYPLQASRARDFVTTNKLVGGQPRPSTNLAAQKVKNLHTLVTFGGQMRFKYNSCERWATRCVSCMLWFKALCTANLMVWGQFFWLGTTTWVHMTTHEIVHTLVRALEEKTFNGNEAYPNLLGPVARTQTTTQYLTKVHASNL